MECWTVIGGKDREAERGRFHRALQGLWKESGFYFEEDVEPLEGSEQKSDMIWLV